MWQWSEVVGLALALALLPMLVAVSSHLRSRPTALIMWAVYALLVAYTATILEGFWIPSVFDAVEHTGYAVAGIACALAARARRDETTRNGRGA